jgi:hypothetical protein
MAALVLVAGVFGCANTMFAAVLARTREMGALRAIGYGPGAVAVSLLEESVLLAGAAGLVGFAAASAVGEIPLRFPLGAFFVDLGSGVRFLGLAAALAAGLLGGIVPALRAVRMSLPDAPEEAVTPRPPSVPVPRRSSPSSSCPSAAAARTRPRACAVVLKSSPPTRARASAWPRRAAGRRRRSGRGGPRP